MAGYYEWIRSGTSASKQPVYVSDPNLGGLVAAGLYEVWGDQQLSMTILTKPAEGSLNAIHPRMPILLSPESAAHWLNGNESLPIDVTSWLGELPCPDVVFWPVSKAVGNVANDNPELIKAIDQ